NGHRRQSELSHDRSRAGARFDATRGTVSDSAGLGQVFSRLARRVAGQSRVLDGYSRRPGLRNSVGRTSERLRRRGAAPGVRIVGPRRLPPAGRALQRLPLETWSDSVVAAESPRVFLRGAAVLLAMQPPNTTLDAILTRGGELMGGFLSDDDFVDLLRVFQLGLESGRLSRENVPELCRQISGEYPANEPPDQVQRINRELVRILAYLQEPSAIPRFIEALQGDLPAEEKLHVAFHARFIEEGWTSEQKLALLDFYEQAHELQGGHSFVGYVDNVCRDFVSHFSDDEREQVLDQAARRPIGALAVLATMPQDPGGRLLSKLIELDE